MSLVIADNCSLRNSGYNYLQHSLEILDSSSLLLAFPETLQDGSVNLVIRSLSLCQSINTFDIPCTSRIISLIKLSGKVRCLSWAPRHVLEGCIAVGLENTLEVYKFNDISKNYEVLLSFNYGDLRSGALITITWANIAYPPTLIVTLAKKCIKITIPRPKSGSMQPHIITDIQNKANDSIWSRSAYSSEHQSLCFYSGSEGLQTATLPNLVHKSQSTFYINTSKKTKDKSLLSLQDSTISSNQSPSVKSITVFDDFAFVVYSLDGNPIQKAISDSNAFVSKYNISRVSSSMSKFKSALPGTPISETLNISSHYDLAVFPTDTSPRRHNGIEVISDSCITEDLLLSPNQEKPIDKHQNPVSFIFDIHSQNRQSLVHVDNNKVDNQDNKVLFEIYNLNSVSDTHENDVPDITPETLLGIRQKHLGKQLDPKEILIQTSPMDLVAQYITQDKLPYPLDIIAYVSCLDQSGICGLIAMGDSHSPIIHIFSASYTDQLSASKSGSKGNKIQLEKLQDIRLPDEATAKGLKFISTSELVILCCVKIKSNSIVSFSVFSNYQATLIIRKISITTFPSASRRSAGSIPTSTTVAMNKNSLTENAESNAHSHPNDVVSMASIMTYLQDMNANINERLGRIEQVLSIQSADIERLSKKLDSFERSK